MYKHVAAKQELLVGIMTDTMDALLAGHGRAIAHTEDPTERLRRAVEAHVRYHARNRLEAFVGNREIRSLAEPHRSAILSRRVRTEIPGADQRRCGGTPVPGRLRTAGFLRDPRSRPGVATWFRDDGELSENEIAWQYVEFALRSVGAG